MKSCVLVSAMMLLLALCAFAQTPDLSPEAPLSSPVFVTIDFPGAFATRALGVNNSGRIVGSYDVQNGTVTHAFLYDQGSMHQIDPPNSHGYAEAYAINNTGLIAGTDDYQQAFILKNGKYIRFSLAFLTGAFGINDSGLVVGFFADQCCSLHGFLYNPKLQRSLQIDYPGALRTVASAINSSNVIVGDWLDAANIHHGFIRENATLTSFDLPGAAETYLSSINTAGTLAGGYLDQAGIIHGFIFSNGTVRTVDLPGATTTYIASINDLGMIVGDYIDANGVDHGFYGHL